jgi:hypothetical protein
MVAQHHPFLYFSAGVWEDVMRKPLAAAIAAAMALASCAKDANQVGASYISPVTYQSYTCPQLAEEAQRVSARAAQTAGIQDQKATNDKVAVGVGLIIFWPALLFTKGNDENTAELARLKGQMDAIEQISIQKRCGITFQHTPPPPEPTTPPSSY